MPEVPAAGEDHGCTNRIDGGDDVVVSTGTDDLGELHVDLEVVPTHGVPVGQGPAVQPALVGAGLVQLVADTGAHLTERGQLAHLHKLVLRAREVLREAAFTARVGGRVDEEALRDAMAEEMRRDADVFLMGEEGAQYQGAYKISQGLLDEDAEVIRPTAPWPMSTPS